MGNPGGEGMKWPARLIEVEWADSYSEGATVWTKEADMELGGYRHWSVGWVQAEDAKWLSIVPHVSVEKGKVVNVSGHIAIPKCSILKRRTLGSRRK